MVCAMKNSISPIALCKSLYNHPNLIWQLTKREVVGRYRGSILGIFWSFINPLFMLAVYTFFFTLFSVVFSRCRCLFSRYDTDHRNYYYCLIISKPNFLFSSKYSRTLSTNYLP